MTAQWYDESSTATVMWADCPSADIYLKPYRPGVKQALLLGCVSPFCSEALHQVG